jgi:plastocyanin
MHGNLRRVTVATCVATIGFALVALVAPASGAQTTPTDPSVPGTTVPTTPAPVTKKVAVNDNYFKPKKVTLAVGDTVTWKWKGFSAHDVTVVKGPQKFKSKTQSSGTYSRVVKKPGTYKIVCTVHPGMEMSLKAT